MGWFHPYDTNTRAELVDSILHDYKKMGVYRDHSQVGNTLFLAAHRKENPSDVCILVYMLRGPARGSYEGWGYKDLDECAVPVVSNCPEKILKLSTQTHPGAVAWREECREKRKALAARRKYLKTLTPGSIVSYGGSDVVYRYASSNTYFVGHRVGESQLYRYRISSITEAANMAA